MGGDGEFVAVFLAMAVHGDCYPGYGVDAGGEFGQGEGHDLGVLGVDDGLGYADDFAGGVGEGDGAELGLEVAGEGDGDAGGGGYGGVGGGGHADGMSVGEGRGYCDEEEAEQGCDGAAASVGHGLIPFGVN